MNFSTEETAVNASRSQLIVDRLHQLQASASDIEATAVVSAGWLTIASALPKQIEEDRVAAMSAAMLPSGTHSQ